MFAASAESTENKEHERNVRCRAAGGELQTILDRDEIPEERIVVKFMKQILDGLQVLHSLRIVHLDIKVRPRKSNSFIRVKLPTKRGLRSFETLERNLYSRAHARIRTFPPREAQGSCVLNLVSLGVNTAV